MLARTRLVADVGRRIILLAPVLMRYALTVMASVMLPGIVPRRCAVAYSSLLPTERLTAPSHGAHAPAAADPNAQDDPAASEPSNRTDPADETTADPAAQPDVSCCFAVN